MQAQNARPVAAAPPQTSNLPRVPLLTAARVVLRAEWRLLAHHPKLAAAFAGLLFVPAS
jgi:hypothetical protein